MSVALALITLGLSIERGREAICLSILGAIAGLIITAINVVGIYRWLLG